MYFLLTLAFDLSYNSSTTTDSYLSNVRHFFLLKSPFRIIFLTLPFFSILFAVMVYDGEILHLSKVSRNEMGAYLCIGNIIIFYHYYCSSLFILARFFCVNSCFAIAMLFVELQVFVLCFILNSGEM